MSQPIIKIFSKDYCPYCVRAKNLLTGKSLNYQEIEITTPELHAEVIQKSGGKRTVPQIFINEQHIGGYDQLYALNQSGELDEIIKNQS